jgi:NAD-dependent deacetylase
MHANHRPHVSEGLRERLAVAEGVFVLTGAGVSAESGVPTFRGGGGSATWKGMPFDVISSARMLERDLNEVWAWFDYRRAVLDGLKPNPAHFALASWRARFAQFTLVTQNIDGLHQAAGSDPVIELHGNIHRARCLDCGHTFEAAIGTRRCSRCSGNLRPDVVLFGEMLPEGAFERAAKSAATCDLCFVVGTSAVVFPAAALPEMARAAGAYVVEVNAERTELSGSCDEVVVGKAGEVLPVL